MSESILIIGAGGFGKALALVLSRAGHTVMLAAHDYQQFAQAQRDRVIALDAHSQHYSIPQTLSVCWHQDIPKHDYAFIILATQTETLLDLPRLPLSRQTAIVSVQKGLLPNTQLLPYDFLVHRYSRHPVLLFTGAAFAKELAAGAEVDMLISYEGDCAYSKAKQFRDLFHGTSVWPSLNDDPAGTSILNALRTIVSFQQGMVQGYLEQEGRPFHSTVAAIHPKIEYEAYAVACTLTDRDVYAPLSPQWIAWQADLRLCARVESRNFRLGYQMMKGASVHQAINQINHEDGVVECAGSIAAVYDRIRGQKPELLEKLPHLTLSHQLMIGTLTPKEAAQRIRDRQRLRFD